MMSCTPISAGPGCVNYGVTTNYVLSSAAIGDSNWVKEGSTTAPTVTLNAVANPLDGGITASRLQIAATSGSAYSEVNQSGAMPNKTDVCSVYIMGNGNAGTVNIMQFSPMSCHACAYAANSWTRCSQASNITSVNRFYIGNDSADCPGSYSAKDIFVYGAQCEVSVDGGPSPYIYTAGAAVTRDAGCY
jgi:hypothetical protein